ncbi:MAG: CDGSH iron-sulfur domain-containing protein [Caulobacterales bacterium]|nr:CDGSH iron-sulfur domain-containing protein [Caulobacterales bacterium]
MSDYSKPRIQAGTTQADPSISIEVVANGPYRVRGATPMHIQSITPNETQNSWTFTQGQEFEVKDGTLLCRCGQSRNKPYCDGSHLKAGIDLTETASFAPMLDDATEMDGPKYSLTDNENFCAFARFCDNGDRFWNEVMEPGERHGELAVYMAHQCPSGRLLVWDRQTGVPVETPQPAALALIEDPALGVSGPLQLRGGIRVQSARGDSYEIRNRQTLCRCGASSNKPFCDGTHASMKFKDGLTD